MRLGFFRGYGPSGAVGELDHHPGIDEHSAASFSHILVRVADQLTVAARQLDFVTRHQDAEETLAGSRTVEKRHRAISFTVRLKSSNGWLPSFVILSKKNTGKIYEVRGCCYSDCHKYVPFAQRPIVDIEIAIGLRNNRFRSRFRFRSR